MGSAQLGHRRITRTLLGINRGEGALKPLRGLRHERAVNIELHLFRNRLAV